MLTIGALAKRSRTSRDTIRFYQRIGLLRPDGKTSSGYKLYGDRSLQRVACIRLAQRCGFSLQEICTLLQPCGGQSQMSDATSQLAVKKKQEIDDTIEMLRTMSAALSRMIGDYAARRAVDAENAIVSAMGEPVDLRESARAGSVQDRAASSWSGSRGTDLAAGGSRKG